MRKETNEKNDDNLTPEALIFEKVDKKITVRQSKLDEDKNIDGTKLCSLVFI